MLNDVLDQHIPLKSKRVKRLNQRVCLTKGVLHSMKTRDKLLKTARISNLQGITHVIRMRKVKLQILLEKQKAVFFVKRSARIKETRKASGKL